MSEETYQHRTERLKQASLRERSYGDTSATDDYISALTAEVARLQPRDTAYNGWEGNGTRASAYATWRVMLEMIEEDYVHESYGDDPENKPDAHDLADWLKEYAEEMLCTDDTNAEHLTTQYALAFLDDVSWQEIAEQILLDWDD